MKPYKKSIRQWLVFIIVIVTSLTTIVGFSVFAYWYTQNQSKQTLEQARTVSLVVSQSVAKIIYLNDVSAAADVTTALESFENLQSMVLYKLDKTPVYQYSQNNKNLHIVSLDDTNSFFTIDGDKATILLEATYQNTKLGYVLLVFKIRSVMQIFLENLSIFLLIFMGVIVMAYILAYYFAKKFTQPILHLVAFLQKIDLAHGIYQRLELQGDNEYTYLYKMMNKMLDAIDSSYKALRLAAVAFETQSAITITDKNNTILNVNKAFEEITGYSKEEVLGQTPSILKSGLQTQEFYDTMYTSLKKYNFWSGEIYNKRKDGTVFPEYLTIQTVLNEKNEISYYVASFVDLTLQKKTEEKIKFLEKYDSLTGLANKKYFLDTLQYYLDTHDEKTTGLVILVDIKDFKYINETLDYATGDVILQQLAERLLSIEKTSMVSRIGQDQYAIWFEKLDENDPIDVLQHSKVIANYIFNLLTQPYQVHNKEINIMVNIGIELYKSDTNKAEEILKNVEIALHSAKNSDVRISFSNQEYKEYARRYMDIYTELLYALEEDQFILHYQPQYNEHYHVYSVEALIRWQHPSKGLIYPDNFIKLAETTGLIVEIGTLVIQKACQQLQQWSQDPQTDTISIAVNVSTKQFMQEDFIDVIVKNIALYAIKPTLLKIELTESVVVNHMDEVVDKMNILKNMGIQISLDDFGTGYSSLQYLRDLPLDQVKIDKSFVQNMLQSKSDTAIIQSIILICDSLDIDVIAEGVETKEHVQKMEILGCHHFQGYYFSKPKPINELKIRSKERVNV